jgi:hypothetical protein
MNTLNSGSIETLKANEVLLVSVRKVNGEKYHFELAEKITNPQARINVLALLNAGDDRFTQSKGLQYAWTSATAEGAMQLFGLDVTNASSDKENPTMLNILNPTISVNGEAYPLHVEIQEITEPKESYYMENVEKMAKSNGKGKYFIYNGKYIFKDNKVVAGEAKHSRKIITDDKGQYLPNCGLIEFGRFDQLVKAEVTADSGIALM